MCRLIVVAVLSSVLFTGIAEAGSKRDALASSSAPRISTLARTLTIVTWVRNVNELLGRAPAAKSLGEKWNPSEAHWNKAFDELMSAVMDRFDELHDAPEALQRMAMPFQSNLTEAEAGEVLALSAADRKSLDDYADTLTLAVSLLEHRSDLKVGSQDYKDSLARLTGMAKLPKIDDAPKLKLSKKTMDDYRQSRSSAMDFYLTAMEGQLQLFWFDHRDALQAIANQAARAARTSG